MIAWPRWPLACVCVLALIAVGCGRGADRTSSRNSPVIVAYPYGEKDMNPVNDEVSKFLVFLPLLAENEKGELEGRLAERWEHSPDYREWTFHLRRGVRWHDGTPVTAHDVRFTLELLTHPDVAEFGPGYIESVTVLDDSTVTVRYGNAYALGEVTWQVCFPKHLLEHLDLKKVTEWDFWTRPVGNGPYRFVRYLPRTMMEFEANPDYYRGKPRIERVVLKFVGQAGLAELLSGSVDVLTETDPTHIPRLASDSRFRIYHTYDNDAYTIYWQNEHLLFRDSRVRRALSLAINRRELLRVLNLPENTPLLDGPYTVRQLRRGDLPEPLPYDLVQARALLEAAGWHDRDSDGVRERGGKPFRFTALVSSRPSWAEIAVYVQEQFRQLGVRMDVQMMEQGVVWRRLSSGQFEALFNFTFWDPNRLRRWFGENSSIGYKNGRVAELLNRLPLAMVLDEEDRIRRELAEIFQAEVPATFLFPRLITSLAHQRIRGLSTPWRADPIRFMGDLWLEDRSNR